MRACERKYRRIKYQQTVELKTAAGLVLNAHGENISADGIEIVCDELSAKAVLPLNYQRDPDKPLLLSVELNLDDKGTPLLVSCCVMNVRRLSQDVFSFHLQFTKLKPQSLRLLEELVSKQIN
tara:strand:- start:94293 stop:94661 length:369 start_codon:yes stop_codon:yes gene_type:complete